MFARRTKKLLALLSGVGWLSVAAMAPSQVAGNDVWKGPNGLGKARLGMAIEEFQRAYPGARLIEADGQRSAGALSLVTAEVETTSLQPFGQCQLTAQFLEGKLYQVLARCSGKNEDLEKRLVQLYGVPHFKREDPVAWYWRSTQVTLIYSRELRQISLADNSWAAALFQQALQGGVPGTSATPVPTP